jgi:thioredoxin-related protein
MKNIKRNLWLCVIILLVIILGVFLVYKLAFKNDSDGSDSVISIGISDLENKIENKDTFILVITQTDCSHCKQYLPELRRTLKKYDIVAYELDVQKLDSDEKTTLAKYVNFSGTPTTLFYTDGEEKTTLNRLVGYAAESKIVERLKSLGYIE